MPVLASVPVHVAALMHLPPAVASKAVRTLRVTTGIPRFDRIGHLHPPMIVVAVVVRGVDCAGIAVGAEAHLARDFQFTVEDAHRLLADPISAQDGPLRVGAQFDPLVFEASQHQGSGQRIPVFRRVGEGPGGDLCEHLRLLKNHLTSADSVDDSLKDVKGVKYIIPKSICAMISGLGAWQPLWISCNPFLRKNNPVYTISN